MTTPTSSTPIEKCGVCGHRHGEAICREHTGGPGYSACRCTGDDAVADRTPTEREPRTPTGRQVVEATASDPFIPDNQKVALRAAALRTVLAIEREAAAVNVEDWIEAARAERLRIDRAAGAATETVGLDRAWQAAWDALPSPTWSVNVRCRSDGHWEAWAQDMADDTMPPIIRIGEGDTEAASLLDVAARLSVHPDREDAPDDGGAT